MSIIPEQQLKRKLETYQDLPTDEVSSSKVPKTTTDVNGINDGEDNDDSRSRLLKRGPISKAREIRLEQNRKAARESRRRKKVMIEELQRSVIFFSRSNGVLQQQNDDLQRLMMNARAQVGQIEAQKAANNPPPSLPSMTQVKDEKSETDAFQSQGFAAAVASLASTHSMNNTTHTVPPLPRSPRQDSSLSMPSMQPGATMQAMANFQQAAAVAMQQAVKGMQQIPGLSVSALAAATTPPTMGTNSSQTYNDTMTALAMQQAAVAAGHSAGFSFQPASFVPMMTWQQPPQEQTPSHPMPQNNVLSQPY